MQSFITGNAAERPAMGDGAADGEQLVRAEPAYAGRPAILHRANAGTGTAKPNARSLSELV